MQTYPIQFSILYIEKSNPDEIYAGWIDADVYYSYKRATYIDPSEIDVEIHDITYFDRYGEHYSESNWFEHNVLYLWDKDNTQWKTITSGNDDLLIQKLIKEVEYQYEG